MMRQVVVSSNMFPKLAYNLNVSLNFSTETFYGFRDSSDDSLPNIIKIPSKEIIAINSSTESNEENGEDVNSIKRSLEDDENLTHSSESIEESSDELPLSITRKLIQKQQNRKRRKFKPSKATQIVAPLEQTEIHKFVKHSISVSNTFSYENQVFIEERLKNKPRHIKTFIEAHFEENKTDWYLHERELYKTMYQKSSEYYRFMLGMKFVMPPEILVKKWIADS